jgi:tetratricopeptide (TPR) repeat protein
MSLESSDPTYELFVSYARKDDRNVAGEGSENDQTITAIVEAVKRDYQRVMGKPLKVFFDTDAIKVGDNWEKNIVRGVRHSKLMLAIVSPNYFASEYCRKEWEIYVETELTQALPGEGIYPIYVIPHDGFDGNPAGVDERIRHWVKDLKRRMYIDWRPFWPAGAMALQREDVRQTLDALAGQIADRVQRAAIRDAAPTNMPDPSTHFVGRRDEMQELLKALEDSQIGAITAVHGLPGIGKSMLAFAYAWGYGFRYPGGRFLINAEKATDLGAGVIALAERKGVPLSEEERKNPKVSLAKVKTAFETGPPALLVVDNLEDSALLSAQARERALPQGKHIHVLVTTRRSPDDLPGITCLPLDALHAEDALALLQSFRPFPDAPQDDEWKAALGIVGRLAGHALAIEVVGVYLRENERTSYRKFLEYLEREGIALMEDQVGPKVRDRLTWHPESCMARLLEPTLAALQPEELRAVEYAALLPADHVPLSWLREMLLADFPLLGAERLDDPIHDVFKKLDRLMMVAQLRQRAGAGVEESRGDARLGRMHRMVQELVRRRMGDEAVAARDEVVHAMAMGRGMLLRRRWGQPGLGWELAPLHELAARWIDAGERLGVELCEAIATPLAHTGRVLDARDLWRRAVALLERRHNAAPENADHARDLSIGYNQLGDLAVSSGDPAGARRYYEDGLAIRRRLSEAAPWNAGYARDLSMSFARLGDLARSSGDAGTARRYYQDIMVIWRRLPDAAPENADFARGVCVLFDRLGDLAVSSGDLAEARRYYEDGLDVRRRLSEAAPENAEYTRDLSVSYDKLGDLARASGDPAGARRYFEDGLAIVRRLSEAAPENADYARDLSVGYDRLGDAARSSGDLAEARRYYEDGLAIHRRVAEAAPDNAEYARDLSVSYERLGDLSVSSGDLEVARRYFEDSLSIARRLSEAAPENADFARDLSVSYERLGDLAVSSGDPAEARRYYEHGLAIRRRLSEAAPENADSARDLWVSCWRMMRIEAEQGDGEGALAWARQARDILAGMEARGVFISDEDEGALAQLEGLLESEPPGAT